MLQMFFLPIIAVQLGNHHPRISSEGAEVYTLLLAIAASLQPINGIKTIHVSKSFHVGDIGRR